MIKVEKKGTRDWVDYLDIVIKFLGGGMLALVTLLINSNNELQKRTVELKQQEINNSLKYGDFTKSLMQDLLAKDSSSHLHRDIALIILNRTLGNEDHKLIANIGYCLVSDYLQSKQSNADQKTIQTVISIVKERDTAAYNEITKLCASYGSKEQPLDAKNTKSEVRQGADSNIVNLVSNAKLDKLTLIPSSATVFFQIDKGDNDTKKRAKECMEYLGKNGFTVPPFEVMKFKFKDAIKYYYDSDRLVAKTIQKKIFNQFKVYIEVHKEYSANARQGILEVWWNINQ